MTPITGLHAIILAGGSGHRLWPLSRELKPKQLLDLFGTTSLICEAISRIRPYVGSEPGAVTVVCGPLMRDEIRNHLTAQEAPEYAQVDYVVEPVGRNTAPAIALAAAHLAAQDPRAIMAVLPSDHLLRDDGVWGDVIQAAAALARDGHLVTIGIKPGRPETGFGYIKAGEEMSEYAHGTVLPCRAERFVEKPDHATAEAFLTEGTYLWNAGIFVLGAETVLQELAAASDEGARIADVCRRIVAGEAGSDEFEALPSIPVDTAVMERSARVVTVPADIDWSDVGSLLALERLEAPDEHGNVLVGRAVDVGSTDTVVYTTDRLVATLGLSDTLVIDTEDATLVCPKDRAQDVRMVVDALRSVGAPELVESRTSTRPWGSWSVLLEGEGYKIKRIDVLPGKRLSLQRHTKRSEHWVVVTGTARVECGDANEDIPTGESTFIPVGVLHRLANPAEEVLSIIEIQVGEYVGEDDIERLEDDWERQED